jgi:zinc/manganese transport system permease protein
VWGGLVLSAMIDLPPSFFIVALAVLAWLVVLALPGVRRRRAATEPAPVDTHHHHHPALPA